MKRPFRSLYLGVIALLALSAILQRVTGDSPVEPAAQAAVVDRIAPRENLERAELIIPVRGVTKDELRDTWGQSRGAGTRRHTAIDIMAPRGSDALAVVDGTILKLFNSRAGGLTLYLGDRSKTVCYYYAHLDAYAAGIREGMHVRQGDVLGYVGTTGNAPANTPHLHFGIEYLPASGDWWKGEPVNPYPILQSDDVRTMN